MDDNYPVNKSWWLGVSNEEFCSIAALGPTTRSKFLHITSMMDIDDGFMRSYAKSDLKRMFVNLPIYPEDHGVDELIRRWILLRRRFHNTPLSAEEMDEARHLLSSELKRLKRPLLGMDYSRAASAFESGEVPTATGAYASDAVYNELVHQYIRYRGAPNTHRAPYTTIVGPSGLGKSFAVRQLAVRHGVFVVYNNLAPSTGQGYPRPVTIGETPVRVTMKEPEMVAAWEANLRTQLLFARHCREAGITAAGLFALLTSQNGDLPNLRQQLQHGYGPDTVDVQPDVLLAKSELEKLQLNTPPSSSQESDNDGADRPILVCFDEARALLDDDALRFRRLRTAASRMFEKDPLFFVVLLDTTSRITNFAPPLRQDPSARMMKTTLFPPIYRLDTLNLFAPRTAELVEPQGTDQAMAQMLSFGRPLWGAYQRMGATWRDLEVLATRKIQAQADPVAYGVSLLAYRMNFSVCSATLAETLVASSMRYLVSIAPDRDSIITTQPSEPILALSAARLLSVSATRCQSVRAWIRAMRDGLVNPGDIGEQVAALLLLFAADAASAPVNKLPLLNDTPPVSAVPFARLMASLLGDEAWQMLRQQHHHHHPNTQDILNNGLVFYTHFVRTTAPPTLAVLNSAYKRGTALFLPCNFAGVDVLVPVRMPNGGMAALLIQIQNCRKDSATPGLTLYLEEALAKAKKALGFSLGPSGDVQGMVGLVVCLRTSQAPGFVAVPPKVPERQHRAKRMRKETEKAVADDERVPASIPLLGIAFGVDLAVCPSIRTPGASKAAETADAENVCRQLADLLANWPDAFSEEDVASDYTKRLLDAFHDV